MSFIRKKTTLINIRVCISHCSLSCGIVSLGVGILTVVDVTVRILMAVVTRNRDLAHFDESGVEEITISRYRVYIVLDWLVLWIINIYYAV